MPFKFQLSDARQEPAIRAISGVCNDSNSFRDYVNRAIRQLLKRGGWFGTEVLARFCIYGCHVTLPRHVATLIGARFCDQVSIYNNWYQIMGTWPASGVFGANATIMDDGLAPTYNDVSGNTGKKIAYHVVKQADIGKTITIYGFKYGGQPLQEKDANGVWQMGVTIAASAASISLTAGDVIDLGASTLPAMTTELVTKITAIKREATQGMTYLYEYNPTVPMLRDIAVYEPNETNPQYRRLKIANSPSLTRYSDDSERLSATLEAMVKLEYAPLVNENDFMLIDDMDAISYAIQAIKKDEAGDADGAEVFWIKSLRELNYNDRLKSPSNQISVKVRTMGSNRIISNVF
jgi:hypothetical protein